MRGIEQYLQVDAATLGALKYQGTWDASTNTPTLTSGVGVQGQYYVVSVAGSTNLDGVTNWGVGDWAVFNGSVWQRVEGGADGNFVNLNVTGTAEFADGLAASPSITNIGDTNTGFYFPSADAIAIVTGGVNRVRVTSAGDVGIGTTAPGAKLDVRGNATFTGNATARQTADFTNTGGQLYVGVESSAGGAVFTGSSAYAGILGTNNATALQLATNGAVRATLDSSGNVGIGTGSPSAKLEVSDATTGELRVTGGSQGFQIYTQAGATTLGTYTNIPLIVRTNTNEQMRITATGDVGIGTSLPGAKLDVQGGSINTSSWVTITPTTATNNALYRSTNTGGTLFSGLDNSAGGVTGTGYAGVLWHTGNYPMVFATNNTERMRIDSSGNLGLGVTPSASNLASFQSPYGIFIGNNEAHTAKNAYYSSGWKYVTTAVAARFAVGEGGSDFRWYNAASGTAGNAISFTQAMTLDASGRLGLGGTTSPSHFLDITGLASTGANNSATGADARFRNIYTRARSNSAGISGGLYAGQLFHVSGGAEFEIYNADNYALVFGTNTTERARIPAAGGMVVGTAALATTATDGFLYVPTCAGAPTGTPTTQTGTAPIVVDTTNNKLYFYSGGQWRDAGP